MDHIIAKHKAQKQKRRYFTKDTENAIVKYNNSTCSKERSDLYQTYIHWPFYKLTENIIHTFKFYNTDVENLEDLQLYWQKALRYLITSRKPFESALMKKRKRI